MFSDVIQWEFEVVEVIKTKYRVNDFALGNTSFESSFMSQRSEVTNLQKESIYGKL